MNYKEKMKYRGNMSKLKKNMKPKEKKFMAFLPMGRCSYYRGFSVYNKQDIIDHVPDISINDVKYYKLKDDAIW